MATEYDLRKQTEAAKQLLAGVELDGDEELKIDTVEGETDLLETITAMVDQIDRDDALLKGLVAKIDEFGRRKYQVANRIERIKALIEQAMMTCEINKLPLPTATLSLGKVPPGVNYTDEAAIPSRYWEPQPLKLNKAAVKAALKAGEAVPGAELGNGSIALRIRRV